jgi:hypothetical protein
MGLGRLLKGEGRESENTQIRAGNTRGGDIMRQPELKETLKIAINRFEDSMLSLLTGEGRENPQVIECYNRYRGSRDMATAILEALQGDPVSLNIMAGR